MQVGVQGMENTSEGSFQLVDRSVSPWRLGVDAHESRGEAAQGTHIVDQLADEEKTLAKQLQIISILP
uniref:Uncharacterized protein n=1 Tax=Salix viminalis TaxID=40686 RepID=A0A6N2KTF0_SALVM